MERLNCRWVRTWTHTDVREVADGDRSDRGLLFPQIFCTAGLFLTTSLIKRWFPWFGVDERKWNRPVARIKCCQSTSQQTTDTSTFVHVIGLHDMIVSWLSCLGGGGDCQATRHSFRAQSQKAPKKLWPPKSYRCATWIWSIVMCITPPWTIKKSRSVRGRLWPEENKISHKKVSTALQHDDVRIRGSVASGGEEGQKCDLGTILSRIWGDKI